jgi:hypothetical protein
VDASKSAVVLHALKLHQIIASTTKAAIPPQVHDLSTSMSYGGIQYILTYDSVCRLHRRAEIQLHLPSAVFCQMQGYNWYWFASLLSLC